MDGEKECLQAEQNLLFLSTFLYCPDWRVQTGLRYISGFVFLHCSLCINRWIQVIMDTAIFSFSDWKEIG